MNLVIACEINPVYTLPISHAEVVDGKLAYPDKDGVCKPDNPHRCFCTMPTDKSWAKNHYTTDEIAGSSKGGGRAELTTGSSSLVLRPFPRANPTPARPRPR